MCKYVLSSVFSSGQILFPDAAWGLLQNDIKGQRAWAESLTESAHFPDVDVVILKTCKSKNSGADDRKRGISPHNIFLRTHARVVQTRGGWGGDGARLFPIPAAHVQRACNDRNFANRIETGLCSPSPWQHKPQSHTKRSKRKRGMGEQAETEKRCPREK